MATKKGIEEKKVIYIKPVEEGILNIRIVGDTPLIVSAWTKKAMQEMLEKHGYEIVPFEAGADIYIINTCTVTNMADRKSRQ